MTSSPLASLPVELFDLIAAHLDPVTFKTLRLCSRRLNSLSLDPFAKRYFSRVTTTLGSSSLDRLVHIAKHHHFSKAVTALHVRFLYYADYCDLETIARLRIYPPPKRFALALMPGITSKNIPTESTLYKDVCGDAYPNCIVERLGRALKSFANVKTVRFYTRLSQNGDDPGPCHHDDTFRNKCFQAVITAMVDSEINLCELSVSKGSRTRPLHRCLRLPYTAISFPPKTLQGLLPRLSTLNSLTLAIDSAYPGSSRDGGWDRTLAKLIAMTPSIANLTLSLDHCNNISHYSTAMLQSLTPYCRRLSLASLVLSNCMTDEETLATLLLAQKPSLCQLDLSGIKLCSGSWSSVLLSCKSMEKLERIRLAMLKDSTGQYLPLSRRNGNFLEATLGGRKKPERIAERIDALITFGALHWDT
ncbi:hypothetical protein NX059_007042 [Plenodomus lindquistii]|nr:hypothetical protein NX059_007042 [Plenodomus lindquistii]